MLLTLTTCTSNYIHHLSVRFIKSNYRHNLKKRGFHHEVVQSSYLWIWWYSPKKYNDEFRYLLLITFEDANIYINSNPLESIKCTSFLGMCILLVGATHVGTFRRSIKHVRCSRFLWNTGEKIQWCCMQLHIKPSTSVCTMLMIITRVSFLHHI